MPETPRLLLEAAILACLHTAVFPVTAPGYTQALIWAIAQVSKRDFPFVVDTPLGRLDSEHVTAVLRDFTNRDGQVFLLSTDREVVGENLEAIRDRVLRAYLVEARVADGETVSAAREGYFGEAA